MNIVLAVVSFGVLLERIVYGLGGANMARVLLFLILAFLLYKFIFD